MQPINKMSPDTEKNLENNNTDLSKEIKLLQQEQANLLEKYEEWKKGHDLLLEELAKENDAGNSPEKKRVSRTKKIVRSAIWASIIMAGSLAATIGAGRYNDKTNQLIKEYVDEDVANTMRLPPEIAVQVAWNGIQKKLNIGDYTHETSTSEIPTEEESSVENDPTQEMAPVVKIEKPLVEDYQIGQPVGNFRDMQIRPYIVNMNADSGYRIATYSNQEALFSPKSLKPIEGEGILGGLFQGFKPAKEKYPHEKTMLVIHDGHVTLKHGDEVIPGEMVSEINTHGFDEIDTTIQDGQVMTRVVYDDNLNTAVLANKNGESIGIGLTNEWENKEFIPIESATAYGISRGTMAFIYSEDMKDQYIVGGSFQNIWSIYSKLKAKNPNKKYSYGINDYGSYANSLFSTDGIISTKNQKSSSGRNSYGTTCFLVLQKAE